MRAIVFRTECNYGSKYFTDKAKAYRYFDKCIALRKSVELWIVSADKQLLLERACFN